MNLRRFFTVVSGTVVFFNNTTSAQLTNPNQLNGRQINQYINAITTAVPFLLISPDSRSGAIGDAGVALSPDANLIHWNPAKLAFVENELDVSLSYSPWLRALVNDMSLAYLSGYKKVSKTQGVGASLRYFTLGNITFTDEVGSVIRDFKPAEFAVDVAFGQTLSDNFSGGIAARFVNSNLTGGTSIAGAQSRPGRSVAADISLFYTNDKIKVGEKNARFNWGLNISNMGAKMRYTNTDKRDFIPTNLRTGAAFSVDLDDFNAITLTADFNKLLVPTPPIYKDGERNEIVSGKDPDVGPAQGMVQSFYDAPGNYDPVTGTIESGSKFREEMREINIGGGLEYWYAKLFAFRTGYFYEHYTKGNRQFITLGAGVKYEVVGIDVSYLISTTQQSPLANTLRFSLKFSMGKGGTRKDETQSAE
ncbi:MAG: type IX secretion system outer membrane channel protein PorV [Phycisphaeraceae bacterium]|nr:type IX secretion system outer membrane channel protein PorV [Phycisphaeraceae bacterium]